MATGVIVTASKIAGTSSTGTESGRFIIVVPTAKGGTAPTLVRSLAAYAATFGEWSPAYSNGYDTAEIFFNEGGAELIVAPVSGPGASYDQGSIRLQSGSNAATEGITVQRTSLPDASVYVLDVQGGSWTLTRAAAAGAAARTVDAGTFTGAASFLDSLNESEYLTAAWTLGEDPSNAITVQPGTVPLTGGTVDGLNATTDDYLKAGRRATEEYPGAAWSTPGYFPGLNALSDFAGPFGGPLYITGGDRGAGPMQFYGLQDSDAPSNVLAVFPWVRIPNGSSLTRVAPPEGYVAAVRARAHLATGFWRVPAGVNSEAVFVQSPATVTLPDDADTPTSGDRELHFWANEIIQDRGVVTLSDYRAMNSNLEEVVLATDADSIANITALLRDALAEFVFSPIDGRGHLFSLVEGTATGVLSPIADQGGLFANLVNGNEVDPGYSVTVDSAINPLGTLAQHVLNVRVAVRLSPSARLIEVALIQVPLDGAV